MLDYGFDETCQGTVPQAITCALESVSFEDAVGFHSVLGCICQHIGHEQYLEPLSSSLICWHMDGVRQRFLKIILTLCKKIFEHVWRMPVVGENRIRTSFLPSP